MKTYIHWITVYCLLIFSSACTDGEKSPEEQEEITIERFSLFLNELEGNLPTRAVTDYAVNTTDDPTAQLEGREAWTLHVEIYKGDNVYDPYGIADFEVGGTITEWEPTGTIHFPNYSTQKATLRLYPLTANELVDPVQDTAAALFEQDILEQNGSPTINLVPAHIPHAQLRHAHSMLDFRLRNVNDQDISDVKVDIGGIEYTPYQVATGNYPEYMLIVPVGTVSPVIRVYTSEGAHYQQTTVNQITNTAANTCYCFTLSGLELRLAEITIAEWNTGPGIMGEYTTEQSYPTFRGPANAIATLYYDNGLSQDVIFNDQGEVTARPVGRHLIRIRPDQGIPVDVDIILTSMVIDLSMYF
ncbi:MAG: hypothetical protein LUH10_06530 [Tannerellaceae bacterium]|nr:hypothetical protein [Tannerellaceae bacterium]